MMRLKRKKGQSTLEYVLVFMGIVTALIVAIGTFVKPTVTNIVDHMTNQAKTAVGKVQY